ncbi:Glycerophosphoryl diester phosphodiesterase family protein [Actinomadura rubteroloni]|uniref:Glycerophosphoryl diester phosphodiesterase family protein n=1 Tax=Actinomadura rubteroloni TaxID=1926885 RepID=A0A2P4UIH9_9ACTN|nr:glycerophosphodiester phosphodiesterase [Actinomadura rubteroloni]POM24855.1 Glycerophosphoryl diester phosphodiesterase family protein [Actinomadura rubteroloni]
MGPLPEISAHRRDAAGVTGLHDAVASGAEYVEIDVRRAGDGSLVVHHDPVVGGLPLRRLSRERIEEVAARPVPAVADAMEIIARGARGHLDLKEPGVEQETVGLAMEIFGPGRFVVTTRDAAVLRRVKNEFPDASTALSVGRGMLERGAAGDLAPLRAIRTSGADMVALNHRLARVGVLRQCARAGYPVMLWTVNAERLIRRFLRDPRVAVLVTDRPRTALALR